MATAREAETSARRGRADAEGTFNRLDTEAKTLSKIVHAGQDERYPPMITRLKVDSGFEVALAAALGDDLDAPLDSDAARHWGGETSEGQSDPPDLPHNLPRLGGDHVRGPERFNGVSTKLVSLHRRLGGRDCKNC